jgi:hypothetical protein
MYSAAKYLLCIAALALSATVAAIPTVHIDSTSIHKDKISLYWTPFNLTDGNHYASVSVGCRDKGYDIRCRCDDRPADKCSRSLYTIGHRIDTLAGHLSWSPVNMKRSLASEDVPLRDFTLHFTVVKKENGRRYIQHAVPIDLTH